MSSKFDRTIEAYGCTITARRIGNGYFARAVKNGNTVQVTGRHRGPGARLSALQECLDVLKKKFEKKGVRKIKLSEFKRLQYRNSKDLPPFVTINGQTKEWVGFGWIEQDYDPKVPVIVDD
jgi:hypothetical protein